MTEIAIRFQNVSKQFTLHRERPRSFQELFLSWRPRRRHKPDKLWVLKDVSFELSEGETLGIIGPNGAGKSTILKLISRIIIPTKGQIKVSGRVSSLLELGAGFHPDLTGRENVFLYGSLLGLNRATMLRRFDQILEFSEMEAFIDAPVRTFSSGMYLRLAFSVAIHVDPEVMLIDEILAVGDQAFRAKCFERISTLQSEGVTILFVSHDLGAVSRLCGQTIWLDAGRVQLEGPTELVVQRYLDAVAQKQSVQLAERNREVVTQEQRGTARWGSREIEITKVRLLDCERQERYVFVTNEELTFQLSYSAATATENPVFGLALHRTDGLHITGPNTQFGELEIPLVEGKGIVEYTVPRLPLLPGRYQISAAVHNQKDTRMFDYHDRLYSFVISSGGTEERYGLIQMEGRWRHLESQ